MSLKSLNFTLLVVNIESAALEEFSELLNKKRLTAPDFFSDAPIVVKVDDNTLDIDFSQLKQVVSNSGFILLGISGDLSEEQKERIKAEKIAILKSSKRHAHKKDLPAEQQSTGVEPESSTDIKTKVYTGRVRSGQQVYAKECDLVVNGDVSAGAEVIADGNIHIYGAFYGEWYNSDKDHLQFQVFRYRTK